MAAARANDATTELGTAGWLVRRYIAGRTDITEKAREQYAWAIRTSRPASAPSRSHGLRHTAAIHMVSTAGDVGELRAIADILGHSPEMLLNTYSHALPRSQNAVVARLGRWST